MRELNLLLNNITRCLLLNMIYEGGNSDES